VLSAQLPGQRVLVDQRAEAKAGAVEARGRERSVEAHRIGADGQT
jgi:hypothetical protein